MNILQNFGKPKLSDEPTPKPSDFITEAEVYVVSQRREERANQKSQFVPILGSDGEGRLRRIRLFPDEVSKMFDKRPEYLDYLDGVYRVNNRGSYVCVFNPKPYWFLPECSPPFKLPSYSDRKRGEPNDVPCCYLCGRRFFWRDMDGREFCALCRTPKFWDKDFVVNISSWFLKEGVGYE